MIEIILCENCLVVILGNLKKEDIMLLNVLVKNNLISPLLSMNREKIIENSGMGEKLNKRVFNSCLDRLLLTELVGVSKRGRRKYYITRNGVKVLQIYISQTKNSKKIKEERSDSVGQEKH